MAPMGRPSFYIHFCMLSLLLSTAFPGAQCKLDRASGTTSSILQDALNDVEDKDIDTLGTEDDADTIRRRLKAIDAERASLQRRLGVEDSEVAKDVPQDGLAEVFERWAAGLTPLLPQLAQELGALMCAGLLTYCLTMKMATPKKRNVTRPAACSSWSAPKVCSRQPRFDGAVKMGPRCSRQDVGSGVVTVPKTTYDYTLSQKSESNDACNIGVSTPAAAELKTTFIRPPPGLELESYDGIAVGPSPELPDNYDDNMEREAVSKLLVDPGSPPGLEFTKPPALSLEISDAQADLALSVVDERAPDLQEIVGLPEESELPPPSETSTSHAQPSETQTAESETTTKDIECSELLLDTDPKETEVTTTDQNPVHPKPGSTKRKKSTKGNTDEKPAGSNVRSVEPEIELVRQCSSEHDIACGASKATPDEKFSSLSFWHRLPFFSQGTVAPCDDAPVHSTIAVAEAKQAATTKQGSDKVGKRKGKQQQRSLPSKRTTEAKHKPFVPSWGLRWPCSLPMTAALLVMLCIVLAGKTFDSSLAAQEQDLAHKQKLLDQLKAQRNGHSLQLALLQLQEFDGQAAGVLETLPLKRRERLQSARADAGQLREALGELQDDEFPQVEKSFSNVYTGWKRILADAQRLAHLDSQSMSCTGPVDSLPL